MDCCEDTKPSIEKERLNIFATMGVQKSSKSLPLQPVNTVDSEPDGKSLKTSEKDNRSHSFESHKTRCDPELTSAGPALKCPKTLPCSKQTKTDSAKSLVRPGKLKFVSGMKTSAPFDPALVTSAMRHGSWQCNNHFAQLDLNLSDDDSPAPTSQSQQLDPGNMSVTVGLQNNPHPDNSAHEKRAVLLNYIYGWYGIMLPQFRPWQYQLLPHSNMDIDYNTNMDMLTDQAGSNIMIQNSPQASSSDGSTGDKMDTNAAPYDAIPITLLSTKLLKSILKKPSDVFPINDIPMSDTTCNGYVNNSPGQAMSDQEQDSCQMEHSPSRYENLMDDVGK